jgi:serine/threonine protein kinase/WD40 repeat protein
MLRASTSNDEALDAALVEYFERQDRGERIELADLIAAYPGCEAGLREFLGHQQRFHALASVQRAPRGAPRPILGDFRLLRELGRGGMGVVYEAEQLSLGRRVAVKVVSHAAGVDARELARFHNETEILAQLRHPNIVQVFVVGDEAEACYYAMELIDGGDANLLIDGKRGDAICSADRGARESKSRASDTTDAHLPVAAQRELCLPRDRCHFVAKVVRQVADALAHAHGCGVLHRDIKPSNILLDQNGRAFLSDFGLARMRGQETLTELGDLVGTLRYVAPELLMKTAARADERSDVYALGTALWEMLAGRRLFGDADRGALIHTILDEQSSALRHLRKDVPRDLETIALCALAKEPGRRYQSAEAMRDDLDRFLAGRPILARRTGLTERALLWAMRNRHLATTLAAAAALLACVATVSSVLIAGANKQTTGALAASQKSEAVARKQSAAAAASERAIRRMLYATDMALAGAAWKTGEPSRARMLLDRYAVDRSATPGADDDDPRGFEWRFLDRQLRPRSEVLYDAPDALYVLKLAPDGTHFVTAGRESVVRWHDLQTGRVTQSRATGQVEINCVSFSPSGRSFVTAGDDGTVKIWNVDGMTPRRSIKALPSKVFYAGFVGSDDRVVCGGEGSKQLLINVETGLVEQIFAGLEPPTRPASATVASLQGFVAPSGRSLLTAQLRRRVPGGDGVDLWDLRAGTRRRLVAIEVPTCVVCDREEDIAFVAGETEVQIVAIDDGRVLHTTPLTHHGGPLALSPDEKRLVLGAATGELVVWDVHREGDALIRLAEKRRMTVHDSEVFDVAFASDGKSLLSVGRDGCVRRTDIGHGRDPYHELAWARNDLLSPIAGSSSVLAHRPPAIRDRQSGEVHYRLTEDNALACAVSGDGRFFAVATADKLRVWTQDGRQLALDTTAPRPRPWTCCLAFAGGEPHLVAGWRSVSKTPFLLEVLSLDGRRRSDPPSLQQTGWMHACEGGGVVFREHNSHGVACLEIPEGEVRWRSPPFQDYAQRAAISRDGRWLVSGDEERHVVLLFDTRTGDVKYRAPCDARIVSLAVAADGKSFFTGDLNGAISVWNLEYGQKLFELADFDSQIELLRSTERSLMAAVYKEIDARKTLCWYEFELD